MMSESKVRAVEREAIEAENTAADEMAERDRLYEQVIELYKKAPESPEMWARVPDALQAWAKAHNKFIQACERASHIRRHICVSE